MAAIKRLRQPGANPAAIDHEVDIQLAQLAEANVEALRAAWRERQGSNVPAAFTKDLIARALAYAIQEEVYGGLDPRIGKLLDGILSGSDKGRHVKVGSIIVREYEGVVHEVMVVPGGFCWQGQVHTSLSTIAKRITGTTWNGPRFFGLRTQEAAEDVIKEHRPSADRFPAAKPAIDRDRVRIAGAKRRRTSLGRGA